MQKLSFFSEIHFKNKFFYNILFHYNPNSMNSTVITPKMYFLYVLGLNSFLKGWYYFSFHTYCLHFFLSSLLVLMFYWWVTSNTRIMNGQPWPMLSYVSMFPAFYCLIIQHLPVRISEASQASGEWLANPETRSKASQPRLQNPASDHAPHSFCCLLCLYFILQD